MNQDRHNPTHPLATPTRAAELARLQDEGIGLSEFIELTGVGAGCLGIYRISSNGVSVLDEQAASLTDYSAGQQHDILSARRNFGLQFPCSPIELMSWYERTRESNGVSDFPLAPGFELELRRIQGAAPSDRLSVPSSKVAAAFAVKPDPAENRAWWDRRFRDPNKYGGAVLTAARAAKGHQKYPSRWYPDVLAAWLVERGFLSREDVLRAIAQHFPDVDVDLL